MNVRIILAAGSLGVVMSSAAFAQDQDGGGSAGAAAPAKLSAAAQIEMLPMGSGKTSINGESMSKDTAFAYGVSAKFDYAINPYFSVGLAPRLVLNVKATDGTDDEAGKQYDLRARLAGHYPVQPGLDIYAAVMPGYSIVTASQDGINAATGFALAGAVGATYNVTPSVFLGAEVGYQRSFTTQEQTILGTKLSSDVDLSYLHIGLGAGTRF